MALYESCLEQMVPGHELKDVYEAAKAFLTKRDASLLAHLPKSLGFAIGLEFRDGTLVINEKTTAKVPIRQYTTTNSYTTLPLPFSSHMYNNSITTTLPSVHGRDDFYSLRGPSQRPSCS